jgi:hypothetical protein
VFGCQQAIRAPEDWTWTTSDRRAAVREYALHAAHAYIIVITKELSRTGRVGIALLASAKC